MSLLIDQTIEMLFFYTQIVMIVSFFLLDLDAFKQLQGRVLAKFTRAQRR